MRYNKALNAIKLNKRETEAFVRPGKELSNLKARYDQEGSIDIRLAVAEEMIEQSAKVAVGCDGIIYDMAV
jgi:hypothetical protein